MPTVLSGEPLRRRIVAARTLRGIDQEELGRLFEADGLGKLDPGRIERGTLTMQRVHLDAFVRHLGVPETWFVEMSTDLIVGLDLDPESIRDVLDQVDGKLETILELLSDAPLDAERVASLDLSDTLTRALLRVTSPSERHKP